MPGDPGVDPERARRAARRALFDDGGDADLARTSSADERDEADRARDAGAGDSDSDSDDSDGDRAALRRYLDERPPHHDRT